MEITGRTGLITANERRILADLLKQIRDFRENVVEKMSHLDPRRQILLDDIAEVEHLLAGSNEQEQERNEPRQIPVHERQPAPAETLARASALLNQAAAPFIIRENLAQGARTSRSGSEIEFRAESRQPIELPARFILEILRSAYSKEIALNTKQELAKNLKEVIALINETLEQTVLQYIEAREKRAQAKAAKNNDHSLSKELARIEAMFQNPRAVAARRAENTLACKLTVDHQDKPLSLTISGRLSPLEAIEIIKALLATKSPLLKAKVIPAILAAISSTAPPLAGLAKVLPLLSQIIPNLRLLEPTRPAKAGQVPKLASHSEVQQLQHLLASQEVAAAASRETATPKEVVLGPEHFLPNPLPASESGNRPAIESKTIAPLQQAIPNQDPAGKTGAGKVELRTVGPTKDAIPAAAPANKSGPNILEAQGPNLPIAQNTNLPQAQRPNIPIPPMTEAPRRTESATPAAAAKLSANDVVKSRWMQEQLLEIFCKGDAAAIEELTSTDAGKTLVQETALQLVTQARARKGQAAEAQAEVQAKAQGQEAINPALITLVKQIAGAAANAFDLNRPLQHHLDNKPVAPKVLQAASVKLLEAVAKVDHLLKLLNNKVMTPQRIKEIKDGLRRLVESSRRTGIEIPDKVIKSVLSGLAAAQLVPQNTTLAQMQQQVAADPPAQSRSASVLEKIVQVLEKQVLANAAKTTAPAKVRNIKQPGWLAQATTDNSVTNRDPENFLMGLLAGRLGVVLTSGLRKNNELVRISANEVAEIIDQIVEGLKTNTHIPDIHVEIMKALKAKEIKEYSEIMSFLSEVALAVSHVSQSSEQTAQAIDLTLKRIADRVRDDKNNPDEVADNDNYRVAVAA